MFYLYTYIDMVQVIFDFDEHSYAQGSSNTFELREALLFGLVVGGSEDIKSLLNTSSIVFFQEHFLMLCSRLNFIILFLDPWGSSDKILFGTASDSMMSAHMLLIPISQR